MFRIDLLNDPLEQFQRWYEEAKQKNERELDAMLLATANASGRPSARVVLHKGIGKGGFLFYTNYYSNKSHDMMENPFVATVFYWPIIGKQVRVEGKVERLTREESESYFEARPYESKIGAWASEQSREIPSRDYLLSQYQKYCEMFPPQREVRCPEYWGGYRLIPDRVEFWISQAHRLHDRFAYLKKDNKWEIIRLAP